MLQRFKGHILQLIKSLSPRMHDWLWDRYYLKRHRSTPDVFRWRMIQRCAEKKVESGCFVVGDELFILSGYITLPEVSRLIEVYDLRNECWKDPVPLKDGLPHSHHGLASDGERFVYLVGGQIGAEASPGTADASVFDARRRTWVSLPPIPEVRYAPVVELLDGRLHVVAGAKADRYTHADEHWSIAVADGSALETEWRSEPPIPHGGHHRGSVVLGGRMYVVGGQERDVKPVPGDPRFTCDWTTPLEIIYDDVYSYCPLEKRWSELAPLPVRASHNEFSIFAHDRFIILVGGISSRNELVGTVQVYDTTGDRWEVVGHLPYPLKGHVAVLWGGAIFMFAGQRSISATSASPGDVLDSGWKADLPDLNALFAERSANNA